MKPKILLQRLVIKTIKTAHCRRRQQLAKGHARADLIIDNPKYRQILGKVTDKKANRRENAEFAPISSVESVVGTRVAARGELLVSRRALQQLPPNSDT